ncbi:MAG TPA: PQQ-binding-like beta-propeller repeat protein [Actinomycetota bacterium]|nr:PQQ-binding-like beta-propeller repeat protein [Actinomycetota bacterium]
MPGLVAAAAAKRFPRGVADPGAARAFVRDRAGTVLALDLATGEVLWRAGPGLRPLSVVGDMVVAARIARRNAIELVMLDAEDGRELRASEPLTLPDWAPASLDDTPDYALRTEEEGRTVVLRWTAQARYRGGAPPSPTVQAAAEREASGAARVDVDSGAVEPLPEPAVAPGPAGEPAAPSGPDVLEQADIGGTRFQLVVRDGAEGSVQTLIRAVDRGSGRTMWETVIDEAPRRRPRPPRP